ncbi:unnamed protein product [Parascedosporium putredinis]|uniref:Cell cycle control protein n=1 Tax=Parascedosporium putredinis TaxID=1442378 RepID=A0A9P1GXY5_9PEZI|nr:unnamed protein product [Parascedosporium putredinis]CAI7989431.1 unnamed protein product [Parascedosporium putredinis]
METTGDIVSAGIGTVPETESIAAHEMTITIRKGQGRRRTSPPKRAARAAARTTAPAPKEEPKRVLHDRELNQGLNDYSYDSDEEAGDVAKEIKINYKFGDSGSQWRMTKLKAVYATAKRDERTLEDVAKERFGSLQEFDIAREEQDELDRRKLYGDGYAIKEGPTGNLYTARMEKEKRDRLAQGPPGFTPAAEQTEPAATIVDEVHRAPAATMDQTALNRLRRRRFVETGPKTVALGAMENRMLAGTRGEVKAVETKRGRERGNLEENDDMSIEQMDSRFDDDLEYMDENAAKLAKRMNRILDACPLCYHEDTGKQPIAPVISLGTRAFLTLPTEPEVSDGGAVIVPLAHRTNLLECDDDEWEEIRNFMKSLTRMYHDQGRELGETIPAYFKEAFLTADEEWSQHRKVIDTGAKARESGMGRMAFRRSIAREMPYFHVWFTLDGGLGHIVENAGKWPRGDLFAREVIGGVLDVGPEVIKKQGRWRKGDARVDDFKKRWRKFDWTRVLEQT